ncbi:hypothetical protein HYH03_016126 [Edaphochlamys debaryana]|uniref:Cystatin domain-containing protein n=1 Tax=Edaphochlamys debaryana TaxID=47281 RepID=A0A836BQH1_9CHLO|nr:hypothetical protein HYH03_016126 [Edaphochlamys debaryana]|eukprot:KAG2485140.1 hypothetical protein HYH03_016126 [Edaphochlamys debaryana]
MSPRLQLALVGCLTLVMAASGMGMMAGGVSKADVSNPEIQQAAGFVLSSVNSGQCAGLCAGLDAGGKLKLLKVVSASSQVVAGMNYQMELLMENAEGKQILVSTNVWSRPWLAAKNDASEPANKITRFEYKVLDEDLL